MPNRTSQRTNRLSTQFLPDATRKCGHAAIPSLIALALLVPAGDVHAQVQSQAKQQDAVAPDSAPIEETRTAAANSSGFDITPSGCIADIDKSGTVDLLDFFTWFTAWDEQDLVADIDHDGSLDVRDFFGFLNAWDVGC